MIGSFRVILGSHCSDINDCTNDEKDINNDINITEEEEDLDRTVSEINDELKRREDLDKTISEMKNLNAFFSVLRILRHH